MRVTVAPESKLRAGRWGRNLVQPFQGPAPPADAGEVNRARSVLAFALLVLAAAPAGAQGRQPLPCSDVDVPLTEATQDRAAASVFCLVNGERALRGVAPVAPEDRLRQAATGHALDLVARGYFAHETPEGTTAGDRLAAAGYAWSSYGENIARGQETPRDVMTAWMSSPGHCRNVLSPGVTELGVGVGVGPAGRTWVQNFARQTGLVAPDGPDPAASCPAAGLDPGVAGVVAAPPEERHELPRPTANVPAMTPLSRLPARAALEAGERRLLATASRAGDRVRVRGRLAGAGVRTVRVDVRRAGRARSVRTRMRDGAFGVRLRAPRGTGAVRVTVVADGLTLRLRAR